MSNIFRRKDPRRYDEESSIQEAQGQSEAFLEFQERLSLAAKVERPVLLIGARGTGKELAASRLHYLSKRWQESFVALNCAALPPTLIESELFGHEEGAFTGAVKRRQGRFEQADGGTLFLDEIGHIPIMVQQKILRVVEYGSFERVGGSDSIQVDVRIVGATNANLPKLAESGRFMRDLLDRLSFEVLYLPPLKARKEDIMLLSNHFAVRMAHVLEWPEVPVFTEDAVEVLESYSWPGNVRELKNIIERAVYRSHDNLITAAELIFNPFMSPYMDDMEMPPAYALAAGESGKDDPARDPAQDNLDNRSAELFRRIFSGKSFTDAIQEVEIFMLQDALQRTRFNQRRSADLLDLTYHQFRGLYRKYCDELPQGEKV